MKYLIYILILLFTSPAFADGSSSAFRGAHGMNDEPTAIQDSPVAEQEAEFKIDERLYSESIGSYGYYGGGFYGEEKYAAQIDYYTITSRPRDFGFGTGIVIVNGQILPFNSTSPFLGPFPIFSSGIFPGGLSLGISGFSFGHGGFGRGSFGFRHR